jgi:dipeptidase D
MITFKKRWYILILSLSTSLYANDKVSLLADSTAQYAAHSYNAAVIESMTQLIKYNTVSVEGVKSIDNKVHIAFKQELSRQAEMLGLDFRDDGYVVVIGLGESKERLGIITHGDVQPADPRKWTKSPYVLDSTSEPGKLIGRGTEDDKGPISTALYAMKAIKDKEIQLNRRIELYIYMAEESDWQPLRDYISTHSLPSLNLTIDSQYPVVTAEKGYGKIKLTFPYNHVDTNKMYLENFSGGYFGSQIPEDASITIRNADNNILEKVKIKADENVKVIYSFTWQGTDLKITAKGRAAHSSVPENGLNAITHLADLLSFATWQNNESGSLVNFINSYLGNDLYGEKFGELAYTDDFMGPMSVSVTHLKQTTDGIQLNINTRRPRGKTQSRLDKELTSILREWQKHNNVNLVNIEYDFGEPWVQTNAPHLKTLLSIFKKYSGLQNAKPISSSGGTNSSLFPNALVFGPSMPGNEYTGHTEHEFITTEQLIMNIKMYTAAMIELSAIKETNYGIN